MRKSTIPAFLLSILALFCVSTPAHAQSATGRIVGTVQDTSGALVAGATIMATLPETNTSYKTTSSESGTYGFEALPPGSYTITVEQTSFKKYSTSQNILTANDTVTINVPLEPGSISETVQVVGTYDKVQTSQSGNIGTIVNEKTLETLPINNRNPLNLIAIQPGVIQGDPRDNKLTGGGTHVFGARDRAINITLDGIDVNETSAGNGTFTPIRTNPDSLKEYRVITSNPSAEFGRNSGAQVTLITKSGTNEFHGNLFEFHRNRALNANEWELNRQGIQRRFFIRNQFGGSIGGPLYLPRFGEGGRSYSDGKDRTFFFFNTQFQRQIQTREQVSTVFTQQARQGIFRFVSGGRNNPAGVSGASVDTQGNPLPGVTIATYNVVTNDPRALGLDPTVRSIIDITPLPNRFDVGDGLNTAGFTSQATRTDPQRDFTLRVDHNFNERHSLFGRYSWGQQDTIGDTTNAGAARFPGLPPIVNTGRRPRNLAVGLRSTLSSRTVNELIMGANHFEFDFATGSLTDSRTTPIVFSDVSNVTGANPIDPLSNAFGNFRTINTYQVLDNLSHSRGAHTFRFGLNLRLQQHFDLRGSVAGENVNPEFQLGGAVDPTTFKLPAQCSSTVTTNCINTNDRGFLEATINNLLGKLNRIDVGLVDFGGQYGPPGTGFKFDAWYPEYDFYFQDDWRIRPNLTLNLGLRWEPKPKPYGRSGSKILVPNKPLTLGAPPATDVTFIEGDLFKSDWNNFGPAIGIAWDPFRDGKTAVRGNFRVAFDRIVTFLPSAAVYPAIPGATLAVINTVIGQTDNRLQSGIPSLAPPAGVTPTTLARPASPNLLSQEVFDPNFKTPTTYMWSLGAQREIGWGMVADIQYVGRAGRNLIGGYERNQVEIFSNGFLNAFNLAKAGGESALLNQLTSLHPQRRTESGAAFLRRFFNSGTTSLANNNVASLASALNNTLVTVDGVRKHLPDATGLGAFFFNDYPQFLGGLQIIDSNSFSNYNGIVFQLPRRFEEGLEFGVSYTFSKSLDDKSYDPTFTRISSGTSQAAQSTPLDANNRRLTYGLSDFDRTHVLQGGGIIELPFGPGKRFGKDTSGAIARLIGGWTVTAGFVYETGLPFNVVSGTNSFSNRNSSRANYSGSNFRPQYRNDPASGLPFLFTAEERAQFTIPAPGDYGNLTRNAFRLPRFFNMDASLIKRIAIKEGMRIELRAEVFNLTNTVHLGFPTTAGGGQNVTVTSGTSVFSRDLVSDSLARVVQVGFKFSF
ncbi:MAG: carboxypeptidase regulatory-like domain-containing protein [Pyrinomonadaceae bacterium]